MSHLICQHLIQVLGYPGFLSATTSNINCHQIIKFKTNFFSYNDTTYLNEGGLDVRETMFLSCTTTHFLVSKTTKSTGLFCQPPDCHETVLKHLHFTNTFLINLFK